MRYLFLLFFVGCTGFTNLTQTQRLQESRQDTTKAISQGAIEVKYPAPVEVTASGNATPTVMIGDSAFVYARQSENKSAMETSKQSFSIDEFLKSVPTWLYPIIIFGIIGLIVAYILWSKTTSAGRASDSFIAGRIKSFDAVLESLNKAVINTSGETETAKNLRRLVEFVEKEKTKQLAKQKPTKYN